MTRDQLLGGVARSFALRSIACALLWVSVACVVQAACLHVAPTFAVQGASAHLLIVFASLASLLSISALTLQSGLKRSQTVALLHMLHFGFATAWFLFWAALLGCLVSFGEIPTIRLAEGYLAQVPSLVKSLPLTMSETILVVVACFSLVLSLALVSAFLLSVEAPKSVRPGVNALVACSSLFALGTVAAHPPAAHVTRLIEVKEPISRFWHNLPLLPESYPWAHDYNELALDSAVAIRYQANPDAHRRNVILIYVDALRADATQPYGGERANMPFLHSLVSQGRLTQVPLTLAACPSTTCAIGALLQSRPAHRQNPKYFSLPLVLKRHGYNVSYVLSSDHRSFFDSLAFYGGKSIDFYFDGQDATGFSAADDRVVLQGLEKLGPWNGEPTFLMLGLVSPHSIAPRLAEFRRYEPSKASFSANLAERTRVYANNYHNGILQADEIIRQSWNWLEENGYLRDAIVVITGDHGESLGERGIIGHSRSLFNSELWTPLWIFDPHHAVQAGDFMRQVDVAPTVLEALAMPVPASWVGRPGGAVPGDISEHVFPADPRIAALVEYREDSILKYMVLANGDELLFDLRTDPREITNLLASTDAPRVEHMRDRTLQIIGGVASRKARACRSERSAMLFWTLLTPPPLHLSPCSVDGTGYRLERGSN